ncbi:MAG TPA: hypothetical protein VFY71_13730 [Planctomycetota bacterium]|nr:hypothetical protein [Planctomycetota bacterium]
MSRSLILASLLCLLAAPTALRAGVLIVDGDGSGDFLDVQSAVNASADGDIILVRDPQVAAFTVGSRSLTIVGMPSGTDDPTVLGELIIAGLTAGQQVVLSHLQLQGTEGPPGYTGGVALTTVDNEGLVALWHCSVTGGPGGLAGGQFGLPAQGGAAIVAYNSAGLTLSGCAVRGGPGSSTGTLATDGGAGMFASSTNVSLVQSTIEGGPGGGASAPPATGGAGGSGLDIELGTAFVGALDVVLRGGDGGAGSAQWGDGGHGLVLDAFSLVRVRGGAPQGGSGSAAPGSPAADGADGQAVLSTGGSLKLLPEPPPSFTGLGAFALPGDLLSLGVVTPGGDDGPRVLLASLQAAATYIAGQQSPLLVQLPWIASVVLPQAALTVEAPPLPAGLEGVVVLLQAWAQGSGLSNAQILVLLAQSPS